jgi:hypothetical protein
VYFTGDRVDVLSNIKTLREEEWKKASVAERIATLQECEKRISEFEKRLRYEVLAPSYDSPNNEGSFNPDIEKIFISQEIVQEKSSSYKALSILVEESHHAFQDHALKTPGFYKGVLLKEWEWNSKPENHHQPPESGDPERNAKQEAYENQSIEKTAKDAAITVVNALEREHGQQRSTEQLENELKQIQQKEAPDPSSNHALTADKNKFEPKSAKVIEVKETEGQDPKILIQFGDNESRWFTARGLTSGENLKNLSISADFASRLQSSKGGGKIIEDEIATKNLGRNDKHQVERQSSQITSQDRQPKEQGRERGR